MVDTTELEGASVCYNLSNNCSGSCIIVSTAEECCGRNGTSIRLLGNDTCLEICGRCGLTRTCIRLVYFRELGEPGNKATL